MTKDQLNSATDFFRNHNYFVIRGAFADDVIKTFANYADFQRLNNPGYFYDEGRAYTGRYSDFMTESMLAQLHPVISQITGCELFPTYSFLRVYKKGDELHKHVDRNASEFSATMTVQYPGEKIWPIYLESNGEEVEVQLDRGDILLYKGREMKHWRHALHTEYWTQSMFFFVDQLAEFKTHKFDKRAALGQLATKWDLRFKMKYIKGLMAIANK